MSSFADDVIEALNDAEPCARVAVEIEDELREQFGGRILEAKCVIDDLDEEEVKEAIKRRLGIPIYGVHATIEVNDHCPCFYPCRCGMEHRRHVVTRLELESHLTEV